MEKDKMHNISSNFQVHKFPAIGKNKCLKGIIITLAVIMVIGLAVTHSYANEIDKAKETKSNLEQKKEETEQRLLELEKAKDDILIYIEQLDGELSRIATEIEDLNVDIQNTESELVIAKQDLEEAKITEADQYEIMKKRIKYMYENGSSSYLSIILQSDNLSDILNHVEYMSKITEYDNGLLDKYTKIKEEVIEKEQIISDKLITLNDLKAELDYEQTTNEALAEEKNKELAKYQVNIQDAKDLTEEYSAKISQEETRIEDLLEQERQRIEAERKAKEAERLRQIAEANRIKEEEAKRLREEELKKEKENNSSNGGYASGKFIWPVPSSGRITSDFGGRESPTAGASSYHKGIDIGAPTGTNIVAADGGTVVTASYQVAAGNYLMIDHGDGVYTVYMHCSKLLVSVGDKVSQGEVIAKVGSTGVSTGPHLHFGVSINGTYVDPQGYVSY